MIYPTRVAGAALLGAALLFVITPSASAQEPEAGQRALGILLDHYASAIGGLLVDQTCEILTPAERRELRWHAEKIDIKLAKTMTNAEETLALLHRAARQAVARHYTGCQGKVTEIVRYGLDVARNVSEKFTGSAYAPDKPTKADYANRLERLGGRLIRLGGSCAGGGAKELSAAWNEAYTKLALDMRVGKIVTSETARVSALLSGTASRACDARQANELAAVTAELAALRDELAAEVDRLTPR